MTKGSEKSLVDSKTFLFSCVFRSRFAPIRRANRISQGRLLMKYGGPLLTILLTSTVQAQSTLTMTPPTGGSNPVVAYDFTQYNPSYTLAQNLAAANKSGNSAFDLQGGGTIGNLSYVFLSSLNSGSPFETDPASQSGQGGALMMYGSSHVETVGMPSSAQISGALTAEWVGKIFGSEPYGLSLFLMGASSESFNDNMLFYLWYAPGTDWAYSFERGLGVNTDTTMLGASFYDPTNPSIRTLHIVLTRSSSGVVKLYFNGRNVSGEKTPGGTPTPEGGSNTKLQIGSYSLNSREQLVYGFRLFDYQLTDAQVAETYRATMFGK